jgi:hypothetical protein
VKVLPTLLAAVAVLLLPAAAPAAVPANADWSQEYIQGTPGGDPTLHVDKAVRVRA